MYSDLSAVRASFSSVFLIAQLIILNLISKILFLVRENREFYSERSTMAVRENLALIMEVRLLPL